MRTTSNYFTAIITKEILRSLLMTRLNQPRHGAECSGRLLLANIGSFSCSSRPASLFPPCLPYLPQSFLLIPLHPLNHEMLALQALVLSLFSLLALHWLLISCTGFTLMIMFTHHSQLISSNAFLLSWPQTLRSLLTF